MTHESWFSLGNLIRLYTACLSPKDVVATTLLNTALSSSYTFVTVIIVADFLLPRVLWLLQSFPRFLAGSLVLLL